MLIVGVTLQIDSLCLCQLIFGASDGSLVSLILLDQLGEVSILADSVLL
jgi:hypothetical protein